MILHYLTVALRSFWRAKWMTGIKLVALAMGLVCFIGAHIVADYLDSVDHQFPNADRIYVMRQEMTLPGSSTTFPRLTWSSRPLAEHLRNDFPELEVVARYTGYGRIPIRVGDRKSYRRVQFADPELMKIFKFPFVAGNPESALTQPRSVIITEEAARGIFGTTNVVGRTVSIRNLIDVTITGVISEIPAPSNFGRSLNTEPFDFLSSLDVFHRLMVADNNMATEDDAGWGTTNYATFVLLPKNGTFSPEEFNRRLVGYGERYVPKEQNTSQFDAVHHSQIAREAIDTEVFGTESGLSVVRLLYLFSGLILFIACLDFANLATAQALSRAKEIGMRKTVGASAPQILRQSLFEVLLLTVAATIAALAAIALALSAANSPEDLGFRFPSIARADFWGFVLLIIAGVTLAAGAYPALILSRVRPVQALRSGKMRAGPPLVRQILVGVQFAAASFLIVAVIVISTQNKKLIETGLRGDQDAFLFISTSLNDAGINWETFTTELRRAPQITGVTGVQLWPFGGSIRMLDFVARPDPAAKHVAVRMRGVAQDYFKTMGVKILAGRELSIERGDIAIPPQDGEPGKPPPAKMVFNESSVRALGFEKPSEAVGKIVYLHVPAIPEFGGVEAFTEVEVIGVMENVPFEFLSEGGANFNYFLEPRMARFPVIRIDPLKKQAALDHIQAVWDRLAPDLPIRFQFWGERMEDALGMFYMVSDTIAGLAILAIVIASLGLVGMATFTVSRRLHEIGVRKTLGASTLQILKMLLWDHSKPVLAANVVAWPLALVAAQIYLSQFLFRMPLTPVPFIVSLIATIAICWIAVAGQAVPAARLKPASVLRYE